MIDRDHDFAITKQAEALNISRGSVYCLPRPVSAADLALMRRIDELYLQRPYFGSRRVGDELKVNRKRVQRLWREEGLRVPRTARKRARTGDSTAPAGRN